MPIHPFESQKEEYSTIDRIPDFRTDVQKEATPLSIYNHQKNELALAEKWAEEQVNISGAWVTVFTKDVVVPDQAPQGQGQDLSDPFDEDADPIYNKGMNMKALFKPDSISLEMTRWGVDAPTKAEVIFARAPLLSIFGERLIKPGDVIELPYNEPVVQSNAGSRRFVVNNSYSTEFYHYRWLYYKAVVELQTGDQAVQVGFKGLHGKRS